jgi:hypothetical protein
LVTSGQVASMVCRPRTAASAWTAGETPWAEDAVGGEHRDRAFGDRVVELLDEHRAALAQLLDHVLVVDDLLADVDRRAVQLEGALDALDGAIDAGAVAARSGEQQLGDGARGHEASVGTQRRRNRRTSS